MYPDEVRRAAHVLLARGWTDVQIARELDVPRRTIHDWRRHPRGATRELCARCWRPTSSVRVSAGVYAELLGLYLGDGHISQLARTQRLRLMLDAKYPTIVEEAADLLARIAPRNRVGRQLLHEGRMVTLHAYHQHWACLFPQHGPGKKHDRRIVLESWQQELVDAAPWSLLRGLIRSDGCVFVNRTGRYAYESYDFSNLSQDLLDLFSTTCASVGVEHRRYAKSIRIYRRSSVALMLQHVGRKR